MNFPTITKEDIMPKGSTVRREHLRRALDELSDAQLRIASEFVDFLRLKAEDDATLEILSNPTLARDVRVSRAALRSGRHDQFVPFAKIKRDV